MRKYTQRELQNEAFRDMLKAAGKSNIVRGVGRVLGQGAYGALKNVAKYISPEAYGLAKSARDIYKGSQPGGTILKDYVTKTRGIPVYIPTVKEEDIISGNVEPIFKDTYKQVPGAYGGAGQQVISKRKNANKVRLIFASAGKEEIIGDGVTKIPFKANSNDYIAYIDKIDKNKQQILAIKEA